jgi:hypothetical protein
MYLYVYVCVWRHLGVDRIWTFQNNMSKNGNIIEQSIVCLLQHDYTYNVIINHQCRNSMFGFEIYFANSFFLINIWNVSEFVAYIFPRIVTILLLILCWLYHMVFDHFPPFWMIFCFGFNPGSFMLRVALVAPAQRFGTLCARAGEGVGWWCPIWWADVSAEKAARLPLWCWVVVWPMLDITRIGDDRGKVCRCLRSHDHILDRIDLLIYDFLAWNLCARRTPIQWMRW